MAECYNVNREWGTEARTGVSNGAGTDRNQEKNNFFLLLLLLNGELPCELPPTTEWITLSPFLL